MKAREYANHWLFAGWAGLRRTALVYRGKLLVDAQRRERVARDEVLAALRCEGAPALDAVEAVVLETDGSFSVVCLSDRGSSPVLDGVRRCDERPA